MSPPSRRALATSEPRASSPSSDRKRKRPRPSAKYNDPSAESAPTSPRSSPLKPSLDAAVKTADTKRRKPYSVAEERGGRYNTMYTFSSRASGANESGVIDLANGYTPPLSSDRRANSITRPIAGRPGLNPAAGARKLVVKNLKSQPVWDSKGYLESIWKSVDKALDIIFKDGGDDFSKEELYRGVENVCRQGGASTLFSRLESRCQNHVEHSMLKPLLDMSGAENITLLRAAIGVWKRWVQQMVTIRAIFFFLDRSYLLSSSKPTLDKFTPELFRQVIFSNHTLKPKIVDGACDLVATDRIHTNEFDRDLFREAVLMFNQLSEYTASFEPRFLGLTEAYISQWSDQKAGEMAVPGYVTDAEQVIASELTRCDEFQLASSTRRALLTLLEEALVEGKNAYLTEYEPLSSLLDNTAIADLTALYSLLKRRRLGSNLRPAFEKWVDKTGTQIVFSNDADKMITHLLSLKIRLDLVWRNAFQRDESLGHGLRETFEAFMNKTKKGDATWGTDNTKVGEMIAKHVDLLLRNGAKAIPDELSARRSSSVTAVPNNNNKAATAALDEDNEDAEVDEDAEVNVQLDQVLDLFRFVHGKAVFEAFYKKDLARRLLMGRSASADAERSMLTRLKAECGSGFTQNLEQMFQDVELSREEMMSYKQRLGDRSGYEKGKGVDLSVNILSAAAWPTYPEISVVIPANVKRSIDSFELHYKTKHSGRKLDWKHGLAHCQMRATFNTGSKELVVSSFQAVVLLLFNGLSDNDHLTYSHILSESGLPEAEVKRTLQSLACAKLRPLTKHPKGKEINDSDTFTVNVSFDHPKYRVKINQIQLKETKEENKETHMRVAEDRNFECQAAIVRIMKSRKTISHPELVSETIKATISRGVLAVADIKKNIDRLIEKDYMEREDGNMYSYVA